MLQLKHNNKDKQTKNLQQRNLDGFLKYSSLLSTQNCSRLNQFGRWCGTPKVSHQVWSSIILAGVVVVLQRYHIKSGAALSWQVFLWYSKGGISSGWEQHYPEVEYPFRAAVFIRLKSLFAARFKFYKLSFV